MIITQENIAYLQSFFLAAGSTIPGTRIQDNSLPRASLAFAVPTVESVTAAQASANAAQASANAALSAAGGAGANVTALQGQVNSLQAALNVLTTNLSLATSRIQVLEDELAAAFDGTQVVVENTIGPVTKTLTVANGLITGIT